MRVIIVTGRRPHHQHLCAQLVERFGVVGIIHPAERKRPLKYRIRRWISEARLNGGTASGLNALAKLLVCSCKRPQSINAGQLHSSELEAARAYDRIPRSLVHPGCDVRTRDSSELIRSLQPDVTVCLGGPVYPKSFIDASPIMLNFHSGISPIYNGAASAQFAFANCHPHLCGGTLMEMAPEIDGGRILGHYLPHVQPGDCPESLFQKTVLGASVMYRNVLQHLKSSSRNLPSIPQPPPLFYTRGSDFGWYHRERIYRNIRVDLPARFARPQSMIEYWREPTPEAARSAYEAFLHRLLWGVGGG